MSDVPSNLRSPAIASEGVRSLKRHRESSSRACDSKRKVDVSGQDTTGHGGRWEKKTLKWDGNCHVKGPTRRASDP